MGVDYTFFNKTKNEYSYFIDKMYDYCKNNEFLKDLYTQLERKIYNPNGIYTGHIYKALQTIIFIEEWDNTDTIEIIPDSGYDMIDGFYENGEIYINTYYNPSSSAKGEKTLVPLVNDNKCLRYETCYMCKYL